MTSLLPLLLFLGLLAVVAIVVAVVSRRRRTLPRAPEASGSVTGKTAAAGDDESAAIATPARADGAKTATDDSRAPVDPDTSESAPTDSGDQSAISLDDGSTVVEEPAVVLEPLVRPSFFERLGKARSALSGYLGGIVGLRGIDDDTWEEVEEALIRADVGVQTTMSLMEDVRAEAERAGAESGEEIIGLLKTRMRAEIADRDRTLRLDEDQTNVWLFVGVNGVGKTTTIGKLGHRLRLENHTPLMAAGDTFRAAAAEQLTMWAERTGCDVVRGREGGDPSAVIFDGIQAAASRQCDVVLADTAGRLQNKTNLMEELSKVRRVAAKEPGHVTEVLLVIDATTGQNGMSQAKTFAEAVEVTGVVLTKLDGSAKGGIVFAIESELDIPVKLVGLGEGVGDLVDFDPDEFVDALFDS